MFSAWVVVSCAEVCFRVEYALVERLVEEIYRGHAAAWVRHLGIWNWVGPIKPALQRPKLIEVWKPEAVKLK